MEQKNKNDHELTLTIETSQGPWQKNFNKTDKIQEVIDAVKQHFSFAQNGKYELRPANDPNQVLKPERTLVSYHFNDGDILVFTDLGVAV